MYLGYFLFYQFQLHFFYWYLYFLLRIVQAQQSPKFSNHSTQSSTQILKGKVHEFEAKTQTWGWDLTWRNFGDNGAWCDRNNTFRQTICTGNCPCMHAISDMQIWPIVQLVFGRFALIMLIKIEHVAMGKVTWKRNWKYLFIFTVEILFICECL